MRNATVGLAITAGVSAFILFAAGAYARDVNVNCHSPGANGKIANVLSRLDPQDKNVVHVSGYCRENLVIRGFDRLTLLAEPGAVIDGGTTQTTVVEIWDSQNVVVQGFAITGGGYGFHCRDFSFCRFIGDTVVKTGSIGIAVGASEAGLTDIVIRDAVDIGLFVWHANVVGVNVSIDTAAAGNQYPGAGLGLDNGTWGGGPVAIQNSAYSGIVVYNGSVLADGPFSVVNSGVNGVETSTGSSVNVGELTVTASGQDGVNVSAGSSASLSQLSVTGSGWNGI